MDLQRIGQQLNAFDWKGYNEFHAHAEQAIASITHGCELMRDGAGDVPGARAAATAGLEELAQARTGAPTAAAAQLDRATRFVQEGIDLLAPNHHGWLGYDSPASARSFTAALDPIRAADDVIYAPMRQVESNIRGQVAQESSGGWHSE